MNRMTRLISVALAAVAVAGFAFAQTVLEPAAAEVARSANMKLRGAQMVVLGGMAQGETPYDAVAAQAAADELVAVLMVDQSTWWPLGSDSDTIENSRALPAIWANMDDVIAKATALSDAATAMQAAAGVDLASLQGAMGALGGACGSCHETYRKPE